MSKLVIRGRCRLEGEVTIGGSKNSSVAIIPAALLGEGPSTLENVPRINDVAVFAEILRAWAQWFPWTTTCMTVAPNGFVSHIAPYDLVRNSAPPTTLWVLLAKFGQAEVGLPGGCDIGPGRGSAPKGVPGVGRRGSVEGGS